MTLAEMRAALRNDVVDVSSDYLSDADCDRFINRALIHVSNLAHAADVGLFLTTVATGSLSAGNRVSKAISSPLFARSLVRAERTDGGLTSGSKELKIETVHTAVPTGTAVDRPKLYLERNDSIVFVDVPNTFEATVWYFHAMPFMTTGTDTPGLAGGSGITNALPVECHGLVVTRAAIMALQADRLDASQEKADFREQLDALFPSLRGRLSKRDTVGARQ